MASTDVITYSLSDTTLTLKTKSRTITIGGDASFIGSIQYSFNTENFQPQVDATGSGLYNINKDLSGRIRLSINQVAGIRKELIDYKNSSLADPRNNSSNITIQSIDGDIKLFAENCYLTKHPDEAREASAGMVTYEFASLHMTLS